MIARALAGATLAAAIALGAPMFAPALGQDGGTEAPIGPPLVLRDTFEGGASTAILPRAAEREPALFRAALARAKGATARFARDAQEAFARGGREDWWRDYEMMLVFQEHFVSERFVSLVLVTWVYTGGAHGNTGLEALTWDREEGREIRLADLLARPESGSPALEAIARHARADIAHQKAERYGGPPPDPDSDTWLAQITADAGLLSAFTLTPSTTPGEAAGITLHFAPYTAGPYAEGEYAVFVPADLLAGFLRPDSAIAFGGEPVELLRLEAHDGRGTELFLSRPAPDEAIAAAPLRVSGEAPAYWFFEGTFPARVESGGAVLGTGYVQADPQARASGVAADTRVFEGEIAFTAPPGSETGALVLENHDPSDGEGGPARQVSLPLRFE